MDKHVTDTISRIRKLTLLLNNEVADLSQHAPDVKVDFDVIVRQEIGHAFPTPFLQVKLQEIKNL